MGGGLWTSESFVLLSLLILWRFHARAIHDVRVCGLSRRCYGHMKFSGASYYAGVLVVSLPLVGHFIG